MRTITLIVVHCSAVRPEQTSSAKQIDEWHRDRGFHNGIGYHFVVTRDGKPALLLVDPDLSLQSKDSRAKEAAQADVQNKLRNSMAGLPRGQQLGAILFTGKPLPRTATGKIKRWELKY